VIRQLKIKANVREALSLKYILEDLGYSQHDFIVGKVNQGTEIAVRFYNGRMIKDKRVKNILWAYVK